MAVATTSIVTEILNGVLTALQNVISVSIEHGRPEVLPSSFEQRGMGVLIGVTGDYHTRLFIDGDNEVFSSLASSMYGMALEGEMLESFAGEVGNMVGGNLCTFVSMQGINLDITPPTVIVGQSKVTGFHHVLSVPAKVGSMGEIRMNLLLSN